MRHTKDEDETTATAREADTDKALTKERTDDNRDAAREGPPDEAATRQARVEWENRQAPYRYPPHVRGQAYPTAGERPARGEHEDRTVKNWAGTVAETRR